MKRINLKNSILNYALEGKLVPQDINNDSVNVLIKNIKRGKEQLIKDGKIKRNKNESIIYKENNHFYEKRGEKGEPICIDDELPFSIPDNWAWIRFENIVNFSIGKTPTRKSYEYWNSGEIPWVSIADLKHQKTINKTKEKINKYALDNVFKNRIIPKDTLLMSFKLTIGKVSILGMYAVHNEAIISVKPFFDKDNILRNYLFYILPLISQGGKTKSAIKGKTLNKNSLSNLYIPLPPLEEQKRIVDKIKILYEKIELLKNSNNK